MIQGHDSERLRNSGSSVGSVTFWIGMALLLLFFGYLGWGYLFGG